MWSSLNVQFNCFIILTKIVSLSELHPPNLQNIKIANFRQCNAVLLYYTIQSNGWIGGTNILRFYHYSPKTNFEFVDKFHHKNKCSLL